MEKQRNGKDSKPYNVEYSSKFKKSASRLQSLADNIDEAVNDIAQKPLQRNKLKGKLSHLRKYRINKYRLIYRADSKTNTVYLLDIIHRDKAYRQNTVYAD